MVVTRVVDFANLPENWTTPTDPSLWQRVSRTVYRWYHRIAPDERTLNRRLGAAGLSLLGLSYLGLLGLFIATIVIGSLLVVNAPGVLADFTTELNRYLSPVVEALPAPVVSLLGMVSALSLMDVFWLLPVLLGLAFLLIAWRWSPSKDTTLETGLDWLTLPRVNASRALDHLVGPTGNGDLNGGEIVVARLTARVAEELKQIPELLPKRVRPAWLHPTLVAVEAAPHDRIDAVAEKYNMTLLVDGSMVPEIRPVLATLGRGWGALNEREALTGVGSASIQRIDPHADGPSIDDNLAGGRGDPLHERQIQDFRGRQPPTAIIATAPPTHLDLVQRKLVEREHEEVPIEVRECPQATITVVRLFLTETFYWTRSDPDETDL